MLSLTLIVLAVLILGTFLVWHLAGFVINIFFGENFSESEYIFKIFLVAFPLNFVGVIFGYPAFASIERIKVANYTVYFAGIVQLSILTHLYINELISAVNVAYSVLFVEFSVAFTRTSLFLYYKSKCNNAT